MLPAPVNYLAHLYLAEHTRTSLAGSLMGDVARGPLRPGQYSPAIERGIRLHRSIDSFTDAHAVVRTAKARFKPPYRRYAGILLDVFFDHCLAQEWSMHHPKPLEEFVIAAHQILTSEALELADPGFILRLAYMRSRNLLLSYRNLSGIERALQGLSTRLSRENPLASGLSAIQPIDAELREDYRAFFPDLVRFTERTVA